MSADQVRDEWLNMPPLAAGERVETTPLRNHLFVLNVRHGDMLVLHADGPITWEATKFIKEQIEHLFDGKVTAIVLGEGLSVKGVLRVENGHAEQGTTGG